MLIRGEYSPRSTLIKRYNICSNVRSQFMAHHQFMAQFCDCSIKCVKNYFLQFYLLLFDTFWITSLWPSSNDTILSPFCHNLAFCHNFVTMLSPFCHNLQWDDGNYTATTSYIKWSRNITMGPKRSFLSLNRWMFAWTVRKRHFKL